MIDVLVRSRVEQNLTISIARDFSRYPGGRLECDGPYTGENFRKNHLIPLVRNNTPFIVQLDGTRGYGSSFLEEAFGGLVRNGEISANQLLSLMSIESQDRSLIAEVKHYVRDAEQKN